MQIPKSRGGVLVTIIVVLSVCLAVANIFCRVAMIASLIWLAFITMMLWTPVKKAGGFRIFLTDCLGELVGRHFVEAGSLEAPASEIRFGYELFGQRFIRKSIAVDKIESIYWATGQATGRTGRDMNDWSVYLWFDHGDPAKSEMKRKWHKPDQDIYIVGPPRRKAITEKFGLAFVAFIRAAGAPLVQGETNNQFERCKLTSK